ncbi:MAG TPA: glycosyltransferase family A protein, partial [Stenomitos sp.]
MKEKSHPSTALPETDLHPADLSEAMGQTEKSTQTTGIVVIGRNEGQRLAVCLESALLQSPWVIYVDSGSTDNSLAIAKNLGADIVVLDPMQPFTAARARNAGLERLLELYPTASTVQFVDGDCQLEREWCDRAAALLEAQPDLAVVCGRRRERYPDASIYNRLCDVEWDT